MASRIDWPPDDELVETIKGAGTVAGAARALGVGDEALRYRIRSQNLTEDVRRARNLRARRISEAKLKEIGSGRSPRPRKSRAVTSEDPTEWGDIDALVRSRGLDLDDWVVVRVRVNEWGENEEGQPLRQLRVDLEPRSLEGLIPARADGWRPPERTPQVPKSDAELVVFFGDQHAPHHDEDLHRAACEWLRRNKPSRGVLIGDLLDFDAVSRHRHDPAWASTMQECVDSGYAILRGYVQASPGTRWQLLSGNHEDRLRNSVIDHMRAIYGLTRAKAEDEERGEAVLSIKHLLRLDELGVEWIGSEGDHTHQQIKVSTRLAARHGWITRKGSGASAKATLDHLRYSCVIGHTHRQSQVFHTAHDIDGTPLELVGVEAGTMAQVPGGLGYAVEPDWQSGFATARIWPDGFFSCDLAKFVDGSLVWANQRYGS